jgi:hypothetical protein
MAAIKRKYAKNMSSLSGLKTTCEADEGGLSAKLVGLALAQDETGADVTQGSYETADGVNFGHLIFEEFTTDVDAGSREAIHKTKGEPLACKGRAFINNVAKNVIVFREKN